MACPSERVIVVSHGTTLSFLQAMLAGQSMEDRSRFRFSGSSGSLSRFVVEESGRITARFINHSIY
jgi:broad specificity phosphatase PhoE